MDWTAIKGKPKHIETIPKTKSMYDQPAVGGDGSNEVVIVWRRDLDGVTFP